MIVKSLPGTHTVWSRLVQLQKAVCKYDSSQCPQIQFGLSSLAINNND